MMKSMRHIEFFFEPKQNAGKYGVVKGTWYCCRRWGGDEIGYLEWSGSHHRWEYYSLPSKYSFIAVDWMRDICTFISELKGKENEPRKSERVEKVDKGNEGTQEEDQ